MGQPLEPFLGKIQFQAAQSKVHSFMSTPDMDERAHVGVDGRGKLPWKMLNARKLPQKTCAYGIHIDFHVLSFRILIWV